MSVTRVNRSAVILLSLNNASLSFGTTVHGHPLMGDYKFLFCLNQFELEFYLHIQNYSDTPMK